MEKSVGKEWRTDQEMALKIWNNSQDDKFA
jgi:hypothetical protein